jgi:hypothetical protein
MKRETHEIMGPHYRLIGVLDRIEDIVIAGLEGGAKHIRKIWVKTKLSGF